MPQALRLPDVDDPTSAAHGRVYQLALAMRRNFGIKLTLNSRVFRDSRQVDLRAAAEQDAAAPDAEKVLAAAKCHAQKAQDATYISVPGYLQARRVAVFPACLLKPSA